MNKLVFISGVTAIKDSSRELSAMLNGMGFKASPVSGSYKGVAEKSFMVELEHDWQLPQLKTIAKTFNQESILAVYNDHGVLWNTKGNNTREYVGKMTVMKSIKDLDNYSIIDGQVFTMVKKGK